MKVRFSKKEIFLNIESGVSFKLTGQCRTTQRYGCKGADCKKKKILKEKKFKKKKKKKEKREWKKKKGKRWWKGKQRKWKRKREIAKVKNFCHSTSTSVSVS